MIWIYGWLVIIMRWVDDACERNAGLPHLAGRDDGSTVARRCPSRPTLAHAALLARPQDGLPLQLDGGLVHTTCGWLWAHLGGIHSLRRRHLQAGWLASRDVGVAGGPAVHLANHINAGGPDGDHEPRRGAARRFPRAALHNRRRTGDCVRAPAASVCVLVCMHQYVLCVSICKSVLSPVCPSADVAAATTRMLAASLLAGALCRYSTAGIGARVRMYLRTDYRSVWTMTQNQTPPFRNVPMVLARSHCAARVVAVVCLVLLAAAAGTRPCAAQKTPLPARRRATGRTTGAHGWKRDDDWAAAARTPVRVCQCECASA
jgi:hypothetical protein